MERSPTNNPVKAAASYSPRRLEALSWQMATREYPQPPQLPRRTRTSPQSQFKPTQQGVDSKYGTRDLVHDMVELGLRLPVALLYNVANGFHNAPSYLLRDTTVRRREKITGFASGTRAAGKEFGFGIYDGVTGIVTQPYNGTRREGIIGFAKGTGQGLGGLVFKVGAAVFGLPGYTLKGLEQQIIDHRHRTLAAKILTVRIRQGIAEYGRASVEEKARILELWKDFGDNL